MNSIFVLTLSDIFGLALLGIFAIAMLVCGIVLSTDWAMRKIKGWFK